MEQLRKFLDESGILPYLNGRGPEAEPVYLVGGAVRDSLQGKVVADLDFIMPSDPTECAKGLAHIFNGTWFMLDASRNQSRVVLTIDGRRLVADFAPFRAPTLEEDLRARDFTFNAIAWPCGAPSMQSHLHDPLEGRADLVHGVLRACSDTAFQQDPLRTLKGIRHATCLHLTIVDETFELLKDAVSNIDQIAPERIRAELARIFADDDVTSGLRFLQEAGLLKEIFGQPANADGVTLAIERLGLLESLLATPQTGSEAELVAVLEREFEEYLPLAGVLKLATFCRAYRPIALKNVLKALRFSNRTVDFVQQMQSADLGKALATLPALPDVSRARARWVANLGREPVGVLFMLMIEMLEQKMEITALRRLFSSYFQHAVDGRLADLVDGNWLRTTFQLKEGPIVGRLQKMVEEAELCGEVSTSQEARKWLWNNQKTIDKILLENL